MSAAVDSDLAKNLFDELVADGRDPVDFDVPDRLYIVGVRRMPGTPNLYDDRIYYTWQDSIDGQRYVDSGPGTTDPGTARLPGYGIGVAVAQLQLRAYRIGIMHAGTRYEQRCFVTADDPLLFCDVALRADITPDTPVYSKAVGIFLHRMYGSHVDVNSLACQGMHPDYFDPMIAVADALEARGAPQVYPYALIERPDGHPLLAV